MNQITSLEAVYHAWRTRLKRRGTPVCVGVPRYRAHLDKGLSRTDCLSMEAMLDHGVSPGFRAPVSPDFEITRSVTSRVGVPSPAAVAETTRAPMATL
jgi:hypothetical protein